MAEINAGAYGTLYSMKRRKTQEEEEKSFRLTFLHFYGLNKQLQTYIFYLGFF